ncbi:MAG: 3-phosphoglycerate dehydrogenase [Bacteroidales bacterium]|nr:3-phosphoglycerate dehydrogenase [Bacteroidales bacterium]
MKILVATVKPFSATAAGKMKEIAEQKGYDISFLEKYGSNEELKEAVREVDALIVRSDKITKEIMNEAGKLKIIVRAGAGYDNLDLDACTEKGITAMNTPGQNSNAVAELALAMMVYISRNQFTPGTGSELKGKTLGIQAFGHVGRLVAEHAKAFGMNIMAFDPYVPSEIMEKQGVHVAESLEALYTGSNFISLHIPATEETKKSIGYDLVSLMPEGGCLVNTARKEVIDEEGLVKLMEERTDIKYVTDIAPDSAETFKNKFGLRFFATPKKMGAQTNEANLNAGIAAVNQIADFFKTGNRKFQVNK